MELEVSSVLEGKVTGITKFGAFVALPGGKSGLVHISEIAYSYVNDVKDFLTEGQEVKVKIISIDENGRINLSIKKAAPPPPREQDRGPGRPRYNGGRDRDGAPNRSREGGAPRPGGQNRSFPRSQGGAPVPPPVQAKGPATFEDQLKKFMQESDSRQSDLNRYGEKRSRRSNGRGRNNY